MKDDVPRTPELDALLRRARRASPPRARLDAVRARLEAQLGPLSPAPAPTAPLPGWAVPGGVVAALIFVASAFVALGGTASVPGVRDRHPSTAVRHQPSASDEANADEGERERQSDGEGERQSESERERQSDGESEREHQSEREDARGAGPEHPHRVPVATPELAREPDPSSDPSSALREEIALLERAMARRRAGDVPGALAALAEHERRFPDGLMAPERERLRGELPHDVGPLTGPP